MPRPRSTVDRVLELRKGGTEAKERKGVCSDIGSATRPLESPNQRLERLWEEGACIVERWAESWALRTGRDPSDTWDACIDAFMKAAESYDPGKGAAFKTYLTKGLWFRLRFWTQKEMRSIDISSISLSELDENQLIDEEDPFITKVGELSEVAKVVIGETLNNTFRGASIRWIDQLRRLATEKVGRKGQIDAFREIRIMLKSL